ncbi:MAG TPA: M14 family metallopeptidase [Candidatus Paceibacterota bacterium]|nr:M14 family metallopeptidase [Candidatus Paceibacterota bacterium]
MPSRRILVAIAALLVLLGGGAAFALLHTKPAPAPAAEAPKPEYPSSETVGKSVEGRAITAYTYGTGSTTLLFVGGMHGGYEWNSVLLAYQFMDYLAANPAAVPANLSIAVIPSINPDAVYEAVGKEGRFAAADATTSVAALAAARFNAHDVDLNRNFACHWQATSTWQNRPVSAGSAAFSEPEAQALRAFVTKHKPAVAVFWHSAAGSVYASECDAGVLSGTMDAMNAYAKAAGYPAVASFDAYPITGDSEGWLASQNIPAITVELSSHTAVEWDKNLAGIKSLVSLYAVSPALGR